MVFPSLFLVHFGAHPILGEIKTKKKPRKCNTHKALTNEAEGTRTLNLRIDSPILKKLKSSFLSYKRGFWEYLWENSVGK